LIENKQISLFSGNVLALNHLLLKVVHLEGLGRGDTEDGLQGAHGKRMVEVLVLIEPLVGELALVRVHEGRVVRGEVFDTALD